MPDLSTSLTLKVSRRLARYVPTRPRWLRGQRPVVSFTFDDVPETAYTNGARFLDDYGLRGTFYIAPGICGKTEDHWRVLTREQTADLSRRGHEIGCHTFAHVAVQSLSVAELEQDDRNCREALRQICGDVPLRNFAFPFGNAGLARKRQLQGQYDSCRGIHVGTNRGVVDLAMLRVQELYDSTGQAGVDRLLDDVQHKGGWLIFYTHDVDENPSAIGCTPALLDYALKAVTTRGITCMTVARALTELKLKP